MRPVSLLLLLGAAAALCPPLEPLVRLTGAQAVFDPSPLGAVDLLLGGGKVLGVGKTAPRAQGAQTVDLSGLVLVPGLVDVHAHIAGGGGEASFQSRTPEGQLSDLLDAGVTTIIGIRGTDDVMRTAEELLAKVRALSEDGISTYMHTGAYHDPASTLTGDVRRDIMFVPEIVGVGEVAVSDHRSSQPTVDELERLVADARVAGLLSGKAGTMYCHMGDGDKGILPLMDIAERTTVPIANIVPTHMARTAHLVEQGKEWLRMGGRLDFTSGTHRTVPAVLEIWKEGLPLDHVSASSDCYGSLPEFDSSGQLVGYNMSMPDDNLILIRQLTRLGMPLEKALPIVTANAADAFLLPKGRIQVGADADIVALDPDTLEVRYVFAKGELVKTPTWVKKSLFEPGSHVCS